VIRARAALVLLVACAFGCAANKAGAPAAPDTVTRAVTAEPATIEEAQAQLDTAHAQLGGAASDRLQAAPSGGPGSGGGAPEPTTQSSTSEHAEPDARKNPCAVACSAIASMKRAVDAICRMAGDGDARCAEARKTLAADGAKVARCQCGGGVLVVEARTHARERMAGARRTGAIARSRMGSSAGRCTAARCTAAAAATASSRRTADTFDPTATMATASRTGARATACNAGSSSRRATASTKATSATPVHSTTARSALRIIPSGTVTPNASALALP
jgi:hypothetical protein